MIQVRDAVVGNSYLTSSGIAIRVLEKHEAKVIVKSINTGNIINVPLDYQLKVEIPNEEEAMSANESATPAASTSEVTPPAAVKERRGKKSTIIDEGLTTSLSTDEIVQKVLASYPDFPEKNVRNLISVRRSKLKKATA